MSELRPTERLLLPLVRRFVALWVRPAVLPDAIRERLVTGRPVVYALEKRSIIDLAVLEQTCRVRGLPSPFVAPVTGGVLDASVLFLERRIGLLGLRIDRRLPEALRTLVAQSAADPAFEADLVPVSLFWGRAPGRERSWLRLLIADDWDLGGRFRKFVSLVINGRNLLVFFGDPLELQPASQETRGALRSPRRLWRQLRMQFRNQRVATVGPDLSHRRTIVAQVLRTKAVRDAVRNEMRDEELERRAALGKARGYAYEIAANYSHAFITFMSGVLGRLWNRLYDGVEIANLSSLEGVDEGSEIIYVPCHRSHMDYLLLSYVVYHKGHAVPHIAAGINLNMPLLGTFLRRGGAFFLRRTFAGNMLYTAVFMKYLGLMMARGHSIEYFIEGGRSRTGRLLQPRTGMLAMTVRSYLREPRRPLVFVPVYFGYERLLEGRTYINELSGRAKERESVWTLLRTIPELRSRFGKVYVSFGEPLALDALIERHAPGWNRQPSGSDERPAWIAPLVAELANEVMVRINAAACATPINLIGLVLLAMPRHSMGTGDLVRQLELYASLLRQAPYSPRVWISSMDGASMVKYAESLQLIRRRAHDLGEIVQMTDESAVLASYFRNNALHLLLMPSLLACAFLNNATIVRADLQRLAGRVYPYVAEEYFLRWSDAELAAVVDELLEDLLNHGLLDANEDRSIWRRPAAETPEAVQLSVLARASVQIIERYYLALSLLLKAGSGHLSQDSLERQCQAMAERMSLLYELHSPEFFDRSQFGVFIGQLRARKVVSATAEGKLVYEAAMLEAIASDAQLVLHEQIRHSILQVVHR
jgi:glycerol-3-phosphate O-acyltransferase